DECSPTRHDLLRLDELPDIDVYGGERRRQPECRFDGAPCGVTHLALQQSKRGVGRVCARARPEAVVEVPRFARELQRRFDREQAWLQAGARGDGCTREVTAAEQPGESAAQADPFDVGARPELQRVWRLGCG